MMTHQRTLAAPVTLSGIGLHSGAPVTLTLRPAPVNTGIVFVRTDVTQSDNRVPAKWDRVIDTRLCTVVANDNGVRVGTIEHIMAALRGAEITNAILELDGPEVPIMDGSSAVFVDAIDRVGTTPQDAPVYMIKVLEPITVEDGDKQVRLTPANRASYAGSIDFNHAAIGHQAYAVEMLNGNFRHEIASARTFGLLDEVEQLRAHGLARGGSLDNAIVVNQDGVMNPDGLRYQDEFIRHKLLDAIGDLYLAGMPVLAAYHGVRGSHAMNNALLRALFANPKSWAIVPAPAAA